ncbi:MAG: M3 family oligoendopeptidase [Elusimicrobia bacterium]|nr:M3 family oligoendopeptidase [Elusimicrobiota bacterium]
MPPSRRSFLPRGLDVSDWSRVRPLYEDLLARPLGSDAALRRWLEDWSDLNDVLTEENARRMIRSRRDRTDARAEKAFLAFVSGTLAESRPLDFRLKKRLLASPRRRALGRDWRTFLAALRGEIRAFRPENVALGVREQRLIGAYERLIGRMQVSVGGRRMTLDRAAALLSGRDAARRREAWLAIARRRLRDAPRIDRLLDRLVRLRARMARNAGLGEAGYARLNALTRRKLDYGEAESARFARAVEKTFVPAMRRLQAERRRALGTPTLKPWDLLASPPGEPELRPYRRDRELVAGAARIFRRLDPGLSALFESVRRARNLDLSSRPGKGPGGFQYYLPVSKTPFIFMNGAGRHRDLVTFLHESGHAFHSLSNRGRRLGFTRAPGLEFCEVASMSMELLASRFLEEFYPPEAARSARRRDLEKAVELLPWVCAIDRFQRWLYARPRASAAARTRAWTALMDRFGGIEDWSDLPAARARRWQQQLHVFSLPLYYLEYGIAQAGALQVWRASRRSPARALRRYRRALALGGTRSLPELFRAAGGRFGMDERTLRPLLAEIGAARRG